MHRYLARRVGVTVADDLLAQTFLGERTVVVHPSAQYHLKAGTVVHWTAVGTSFTGRPPLPKRAAATR